MSAAARRSHVTGNVSLRRSALAVDSFIAPYQGRAVGVDVVGQAFVEGYRKAEQRLDAIGLATQRVLEQKLLPANALANVGLGAIEGECKHDVVDRGGHLRWLCRNTTHFGAHQRARQLPRHGMQTACVLGGVVLARQRYRTVPNLFAAHAIRDEHVHDRLVALLAYFSVCEIAQAALMRGRGRHRNERPAARQHGPEVALDRFRTTPYGRIVRQHGKGPNADRHRARLRGPAHRPRTASEIHHVSDDRPSDILDPLLARVGERDVEAAVHLVAHGLRHADAAGRSKRLQPGRDVDAVAEDVVAFGDHVAEVDADAELEPVVCRRQRIAAGERALDRNGAAQRCIGAAELGQEPVTGRFHDAAAIRGNGRIDDLAAHRAQARERARVIVFHLGAEADDVGHQHGGQPARGHPSARAPIPATRIRRAARACRRASRID
jgi:hypothetical protein